MTTLPDSLIQKLRRDQLESYKYLEREQLLDSTQSVKQLAESKLLAITGKAVDVVEEVMDFGLPKDRLAAAGMVLDHSPATMKVDRQQVSESQIPAEAMRMLMDGMSRMFGMALQQRPSLEGMKDVSPEPKLVPGRKRGKRTKAIDPGQPADA